MARESKEQHEADRSRGRLASDLQAAFDALYRLGYTHGYEDAKKGLPSVITQTQGATVTKGA